MSDRKIEQECADVSFPQLSVYDLMLYYFPDRNGTISRIRKLDENSGLRHTRRGFCGRNSRGGVCVCRRG